MGIGVGEIVAGLMIALALWGFGPDRVKVVAEIFSSFVHMDKRDRNKDDRNFREQQ